MNHCCEKKCYGSIGLCNYFFGGIFNLSKYDGTLIQRKNY